MSHQPLSRSSFFKELVSAAPANRAEVRTQVLLRLFRLLGFAERDRADKPLVPMHFGRERKLQTPDFIFHASSERSFSSALVTVEARAPTEGLSDAGDRALAYADWAGTPLYLACNGHELAAVQVTPGLGIQRTFRLRVRELPQYWARIFELLGRTHAILFKEALQLLEPGYLPGIEQLPPGELFTEYLDRLSTMWPAATSIAELPTPAATPPGERPTHPVKVTMSADDPEHTEETLAGLLSEAGARLIIEGSSGSGKSTLARRLITHLTHRARGTNAELLPVYLAVSHGIPSSLPEAFARTCQGMGINVPPALLSRFLQSARVVLVLDGLDESPEPESAVDTALRWLGTASNLSVCITSRQSALEELHQTFLENEFQFAHVRPLTDAELGSLFQAHLENRELTSRLLAYSASRHALRSPLMALLAVRVATTHARFDTLSDYELIREYVRSLSAYRDSRSPTTAGPKNRLATLLDVLADAAVWIARTGQEKNTRPSLRDLRDHIQTTHGAEAVEALLSTGLISSSGGGVKYLHESFGDFALASALLRALRARDFKAFGRVPATDQASRLAHSALQGGDELALIAALEARWNDARRLRRAMGILKFGCSERALHAMLHVFRCDPENPLPAWDWVAPILIKQAPEELRPWLEQNWEQLPLNSLRWMVERVAKAGGETFAPWLLTVALREPSQAAVAFHFIYRHALHAKGRMNEVVELFSRASEAGRKAICTFLLRARRKEGTQELASALLLRESSPGIALRLLLLRTTAGPGFPDEVMAHVNRVVSQDFKLTATEREATTRLLGHVNFHAQPGTEPLRERLEKLIGRRA